MNVSDFKPGLILGGSTPGTSGKGTGLVLPGSRIKGIKALSLAKEGEKYEVPTILDAKSRLLPAGDQLDSSECVAFTLAGLAQFWQWKYLGIRESIDPHAIYLRAKALDGIPGEGTTLESGYQAAQDVGAIPPILAGNIREVQNWYEMPRALHRFDVAVVAWSITDSWFQPDAEGFVLPGGKVVGGHATLLCGASSVDPKPFFEWQGSWSPNQGVFGFSRMSPELFSQQFQFALLAQWPGPE